MYQPIPLRLAVLLVHIAVGGPAVWAAPAPTADAHPPPTIAGDAVEYAKCIRSARQSPADGLAEALAWGTQGGGEPASHCAAIALIGMRNYDEGASRLESLAATSARSAHIRAGMLDQAAQAWMLAKNAERAEIDLDKALALVAKAPDLLVDRAVARADQHKYDEALSDLDLALGVAPGRADALTFRASAKRHRGDLAGARDDLAAALAVAPDFQDAWLEKGILAAQQGELATARTALQKTVELAPDSAAATTARQDLDILDAPPQ